MGKQVKCDYASFCSFFSSKDKHLSSCTPFCLDHREGQVPGIHTQGVAEAVVDLIQGAGHQVTTAVAGVLVGQEARIGASLQAQISKPAPVAQDHHPLGVGVVPPAIWKRGELQGRKTGL